MILENKKFLYENSYFIAIFFAIFEVNKTEVFYRLAFVTI